MDNPISLDAAAGATAIYEQSLLFSPLHEDTILFKGNVPRLEKRRRRKMMKSLLPKRNSSFPNSFQWKPIGSFSMSTLFPYINGDVHENHKQRGNVNVPKWMPVSPSKQSQFTTFPYASEYSSDDDNEYVDMAPADAIQLLSDAHKSIIKNNICAVRKSKSKTSPLYSNGSSRPFIVAPPRHKLRFQVDYKYEANENAPKQIENTEKALKKVKKQRNLIHEKTKVKTHKRRSSGRSRCSPPNHSLSMPRWQLTESGKRGAVDGYFSPIQYLHLNDAIDQKAIRHGIGRSKSFCTQPRWRAASPMRCEFLGRAQFQHKFESNKRINRWEKDITKIAWDKLKMVHRSMYGQSLQSHQKPPFRVSPPKKTFISN